jgi:hypothetical protein
VGVLLDGFEDRLGASVAAGSTGGRVGEDALADDGVSWDGTAGREADGEAVGALSGVDPTDGEVALGFTALVLSNAVGVEEAACSGCGSDGEMDEAGVLVLVEAEGNSSGKDETEGTDC